MNLSKIIPPRGWYVLSLANLLFMGANLINDLPKFAFINLLASIFCFLCYLINRK